MILKILNLLEAPFEPRVVDAPTSRNLFGWRQREGGEQGQEFGAYSKVKPDTDPHLVRKSSLRSSPEEFTEGFKAFIQFIIDNNFIDNIHMPRVYEVKTIKGSDGYKIDTFRTEKLVGGDEINQEQMQDYLEQVTGDRHDELAAKYGTQFTDKPHKLLANIIKGAVHSGKPPFASDELNKACLIVRKAIRSIPEADNDLHFNNIMFRRTPVGIQVVLNDPVYIDSNY